MLPVLLAIFGLFLQPVILLYDRAVMQAAASEACRVVATQTASDSAVEAYVLRRLQAVPQVAIFHIGGDDGWEVQLEGGELADEVCVTIAHEVDPLPLLGVSAGLAGSMQADGACQQVVQATSALQPSWATALSSDADDWIGAWE